MTFPIGYQAFAPCTLVRSSYFTTIHNRGGHVWVEELNGQPLLAALFTKLICTLHDAIVTKGTPHLQNHLIDILETLDTGYGAIGSGFSREERPEVVDPTYTLEVVYTQVLEIHGTIYESEPLAEQAAKLVHVLGLARQAVFVTIDASRRVLQQQMVINAMRLRRRLEGQIGTWMVVAIALPGGDPLCESIAAEVEPFDPAHLQLKDALLPERLSA